MVSEESLVKVTGSIRPTIQRAVSFLREQQWIDLLKVGTANAYQVNSGVFGTACAHGRWLSDDPPEQAQIDPGAVMTDTARSGLMLTN